MKRRNSRRHDNVSWTDSMVNELLFLKKEAIFITKGDNPPRKSNGRKMGYMEYLLKRWNEKGYEHLGLNAQNLVDVANQTERKSRKLESCISQTIDIDRINSNVQDIISTDERTIDNTQELLNTHNEHGIDIVRLDKLIEHSEEVFNSLHSIVGDFSKRAWKTKFRTTLKDSEINYIDNACLKLISKTQIMDKDDKLMSLWILNCIVYSVIVGWIILNDIPRMTCESVKQATNRIPQAIKNIEIEIKRIRALTSKCSAEISRLKCHNRLTRKSKRNRLELAKLCVGTISIYSLTCLFEKLKKRLLFLSRKRKRKLRSLESSKINNEFMKDQKSIFKKFKECIKKDPDNLNPIYKDGHHVERRYFEKPEDVEVFWRNLWQAEDKGNPDVPWLDDVRSKMSEIVPNPYEGDLEVTANDCSQSIKKKKNWSAAGPDKITNYWLKKLPSILPVVTGIFRYLINFELGIQRWFCGGRTSLFPKDGEWCIPNQRPITCLNTMYKWMTSLLNHYTNNHMETYSLMQIDQRGAKKECSGTTDNLLIDDMVLRDARLHARNLFCFWVDVKKAFDSVSHSWLITMLKLHRLPLKLVNILVNIIKNWNLTLIIPTKDGDIETENITLTNGIMQGDSFCPTLYTMIKNPISWLVRSFPGYILSTPIKEKVTHTLFIDDLKGYTKSLREMIFEMNVIKGAMNDGGLIWNASKSKVLGIERGKYTDCGDVTLRDGTVVESLKPGETYKYMGVQQSTKNEVEITQDKALKKIKQRTHIVWSSKLSDWNKILATNVFVNSSIFFFFWTIKFTIDFLRTVDRSIRGIVNTLGGKHTNLLNAVLYAPRFKGGRGLHEVERLYKETKVKAAVKLIQNNERRMELVKRFHLINSESTSYSLFKEARKYAEEFEISLKLDNDECCIRYKKENEILESSEYSVVSRELVKNRNATNISTILSSSWQGVNYKARVEDENIVISYFDWLKNWRCCPTETVSEFFLLFYQLLPTKCYKVMRSSEVISDTLCRLCMKGQESVTHLMNNCGALVKSTYMARHNNALKCFVFPLLHELHLIDNIPAWWSNVKVKPFYSNDEFCFWWDAPEYSGTDGEDDSKCPRPDGKIQLIKEKKFFLVEITVPWHSNRVEKYEYKKNKYTPIQQNLKFENPGYEVDQITLVIDSFGGYDINLKQNIAKVISDKSVVQRIITNMQKSVISSAAHLSRRCKINFM